MKVYRRHRCASRHRTHRTLAKCMFRRAAWIAGTGPYALIAWCSTPTITLWPTAEAAETQCRSLSRTACGGRCTGRHEVVVLALAQQVSEEF